MSYTQPLLPILVVILLAAWIRMRLPAPPPEKRQGRRLLAISAIGLIAISWPPLQCLFALPLEAPFWDQPTANIRPEAIVVLGSAVDHPTPDQPFATPDRDSITHCAMAAWLYRANPQIPLLASEGSHGTLLFPSVLVPLLRGFGVPEDHIWLEDHSRNTRENAVYAAKLLAPYRIRRIALVTDAQSMARAAACFRKQGLAVIPAPCDFSRVDFTLWGFLPSWDAIRRNERGLHEFVGLAWYALRGWI